MPDVAYRLTFSDDTTIDCCADHLWVTWTHAERKTFLRSPYEDTSRFPDDWPTWRRSRLHSHSLSQDVVEAALELAGTGMSVRQIEAVTGTSRNALAKHLQAGCYVPREPRIYPDSPGPQIRTTQDVVNTLTHGSRGDTNHCIPVCGALELPERDLPVEPYVMGYWLGNGTVGDGAVTCGSHNGDVDWPHIQEAFEGAGYDTVVRHYPDKASQIRSTRLRDELRRARVLHGKAVPLPYLRASMRQRLALLRGLMDSDGYADPVKGTVEFSNTDKPLADAVFELAASLGQKPVLATKRAMLYGKDCGPAHRVTWRPTVQVFSLPRKADRLTFDGAQSLRSHHRMIVSAERIPPAPMRCLTVSSPNAMFLVGRSMLPTHNTRSSAEWVRSEMESGRRRQLGIIGPTADAVRRIQVEGPSGILAVCPPWCRPSYEPSTRKIVWPNGSVAYTFSSEEPDRLRGPNFDAYWADEVTSWSNAAETFDMIMMALRIPGPQGHAPRGVVSTTPKNQALLKAIMAAPSTVITRAKTSDNATNLDASTLQYLNDKYGGSRLGRQELDAELLQDLEGALWSRDLLDACRVKRGDAPEMKRVVVAIDPPGASSKDSAECGIIVAGLGADRHGYVLADLSGRYSPEQWARRAVGAYHGYKADRIVAEKNFGGEMVESTIRSVDQSVAVRMVTASRGKQLRAEPVASWYEQHRVHHVGEFPALEDQMTGWCPTEPGPSPDRVDACIAQGSLVKTRRGEVPIEDVVVGDYALTRRGYRKVTATRMTSLQADVVLVGTPIGSIFATADHRFYVNGVWTRADTIVCGDIATGWKKPLYPSILMDLSSSVSRIAQPGLGGFIIQPMSKAGVRKESASYTSRSGSMRTAWIAFLKDISSTTLTTIRSTIRPTISSVSTTASMVMSTPTCSGPLNNWRIWPTYGHLPLCGTALRKAGLGTVRTASGHGMGLCSAHSAVSPVVSSSSRVTRARLSGSVPDGVTVGSLTGAIGIRLKSLVRSVRGLFGRTSTLSAPRLAQACVVRVSKSSERLPVYDLTVEGEHEFFANGLLVHNCVWACTSLMGGPGPMKISPELLAESAIPMPGTHGWFQRYGR
jgi:phage terminase large subunit-like protein